MNKFSELEAFAAVVDQGGFTDAAKQIGMSKSAVSKNIAALESRLGARLLNRSTRRVAPTEIGSAYYARISKILNETSEADAFVSSLQSKPTGVLSIGCEADFGIYVLTPLLKDFRQQYPHVNLVVEMHRSPKNLIENGWDVAIRTGRLPDSELIARKVGSTTTHFVAGRGYLEARGRPVRADHLKDHELIHSGPQQADATWKIRGPRGQMWEIRNLGGLCLNEGTAQLEAAKANLGIARLPKFICGPAIASGELVEVLPDYPAHHLGIFVQRAASEHTPPKVSAFVDFLAENVSAPKVRERFRAVGA